MSWNKKQLFIIINRKETCMNINLKPIILFIIILCSFVILINSLKESDNTADNNDALETTVYIKPTETKGEEEIKPTEAITEPTEKPIDPTEETIVNKPNLINLGEFRLTAYCNCKICCGKWAGGATASGAMPVANHTIAVDTDIIPFGTKVIINGITYVAEDTGSAIYGKRIDIYFDTHQEALNFGIQYADVYVVLD
jgi:3D (Asp-Asp-Asp) domain-containing protein